MSPAARAHLSLPDGTVTSRYSDVLLLHEATTTPLLDYIRRKYRWDASTLHSIHWGAHTLAIKRTMIPHTHLVKLLHRMLPTHALANKFDGGTRTCPLCSSNHEDFAHIIRCEHPSRERWRTEFLSALRDLHIHTNTSPRLSALMLDGIRLWFTSQPETDVSVAPEAYHPTLQSLVNQQNQIGWDQLFLGRFCKEWSLYQQRYLSQLDSENSDNLSQVCVKWQAKIIQLCWQNWFTLWKLQNQEVHGHDERSRTEATKREVRYQLANIYRHRNMYESHVQRLLHRDPSSHDQHALSVTKNWLSINTPIFRESYRRVKQRALSGMRSIREYFGHG